MELSNSPKAPLTGRELLALLQPGGIAGGIGALLAELGSLPRGAMLLTRAAYVADTAGTADADPGTAKLRWNNATQEDATVLYLDDVDGDANDHGELWASLNVGGYLYAFNPADPSVSQQWQISSIVDAVGYLKLGVTLVECDGSFTFGDSIALSLQQPTPSPGFDRSAITPLTSASGTLTADFDAGDYFTVDLSEDIADFAFDHMPGAGNGVTLAFLFTQDSTARDITWPAEFNWGEGAVDPVMPTGAGDQLFLIITTFDNGANWDASARVRA